MAEPSFDVLFAGELHGAASAEHVKHRLALLFKLDQSAVERLFSGQRVFVKRGVDGETAERYRLAFYKAGAVVEITQVSGESQELFRFDDTDDHAHQDAKTGTNTPSLAAATAPESVGASLSLAPVGAPLEELSDRAPAKNPDVSQLSLVEGEDWSLEDCAPPPVAVRIPDIDSLTLDTESTRPDKPQEF